MYKNGEIYSVMEEFEKIADGRFDKEDKAMWKKGQYYEDGQVNNFFKMYLHGYMGGKCAQRLGLFN